jgi:hypothetical protein
MKNPFILCLSIFLVTCTYAQVGIGTVSPTSTLDIRGSFSAAYRSFTTSTSASLTDYTLAFTGIAACSVTLPDATVCAGRVYLIKNASTTGPTPVLTISTTSSQTIDGITSWLLDQAYESLILVSNGANWHISAQTAAAGAGTAWTLGGNNVVALQKFGTISNFDLPVITNNTEKMRLSATGNLAVGTSVFNATNPEKFIVDAGVTTSVNAIVGRGNINNYLQLNIQNINAGLSASSDVVATADNGTETTNYVDMGINSSVNNQNVMGLANDAYLYNVGQNFLIGTGTAAKSLVFMTGGTTQATNERMRIDGSGNVGIGLIAPLQKLHVTGNFALTGAFMPGNLAGLAGTVLTSTGPGTAPSWNDPTTSFSGIAWELPGNNVASMQKLGTTSNFSLPIITNNVERMRVDSMGNVAIGGLTTSGAANAEKLLINAGTTTSPNLVSALGSINNYLQSNVQNTSGAGSSSSDLVATNDVSNYIDLGINSSGYTLNVSPILNGANNAYLYTTGNDFIIGDSTAGKNLIFFTGGAALTNERMRITSAGNIGIGDIVPTTVLDVNGTVKMRSTVQVGAAGTPLDAIIRFTNQSITDNTGINFASSQTETFALAGVSQFATVIVTPRSPLPGALFLAYAYASAANTVKVIITNVSFASTALGTIAFDITVIQ